MSTPQEVRDQLLRALRGASAHPEILKALEGVPAEARGRRVAGAPHSLWQILEHLRLAQWDILDYGRNPDYRELEFPKDYWPASEAPPNDAAWRASLAAFRADLESIQKMVSDPDVDLLSPIPHLDGVTWFRQAMLIVSHNAYHIGQAVQLRRALGCWEG
jgi:hypothetical protein